MARAETIRMQAVITAEEKAEVRATVFAHLRGIVLAPVVLALADRGVFNHFRDISSWVDLDQIMESRPANRGYLLAALRLLASAGWLKWRRPEHEHPAAWALTEEGAIAVRFAPDLYREVVSFIPAAILLEDFIFTRTQGPILPSLTVLAPRVRERWGIGFSDDPLIGKVHEEIRVELNGMLIGPAIVALARHGILERLQEGALDIRSIEGNQSCLQWLFEPLISEGWLAREQNRIRLTASGEYAAEIAAAYGVTVSYLPMFSVIGTMLFGNARLPRVDDNGNELLVNRAMNVWGSGGAHKTYFRKVDEIIIELFNRPIEQQPRGVCDMGCGDGTFLEHVYGVIAQHTLRGRMLAEHPLTIVGADFNKVARRVTKQNFRKAHIPHAHVIYGDINRPALLAGDLEEIGLDIHDLLHVRSFLDHNRPFLQPSGYARGTRPDRSTGAFAHLGEEIPPDELEENLVRHLRRWAPYVGRFGLLVLELHTIPPELAAAHLDKTPAVAYDGTHSFSDQYLIEIPVFLQCAREAGLTPDPRYQAQYPASDLATVSINVFCAAPQ